MEIYIQKQKYFFYLNLTIKDMPNWTANTQSQLASNWRSYWKQKYW